MPLCFLFKQELSGYSALTSSVVTVERAVGADRPLGVGSYPHPTGAAWLALALALLRIATGIIGNEEEYLRVVLLWLKSGVASRF